MSTEDDIELVLTCGACPEQYDAFLNGELVGYLRLRHGQFTVDCKEKRVYTASPKGDGLFEPDERDDYLSTAKLAILAELEEPKEKPKTYSELLDRQRLIEFSMWSHGTDYDTAEEHVDDFLRENG